MHSQTRKPTRQLRWLETCHGQTRTRCPSVHLAIDDLSRAQQHRGLVKSPSMHHELNRKWRKSKKRHNVPGFCTGCRDQRNAVRSKALACLSSKPTHLLLTRRDVKSRTEFCTSSPLTASATPPWRRRGFQPTLETKARGVATNDLLIAQDTRSPEH